MAIFNSYVSLPEGMDKQLYTTHFNTQQKVFHYPVMSHGCIHISIAKWVPLRATNRVPQAHDSNTHPQTTKGYTNDIYIYSKGSTITYIYIIYLIIYGI